MEDSDDDLNDPQEEIRLLQAVIATAGMLKKDVQDADSLQAITRAISSLILSKQRAQQLQIERHRLIAVEEVEQFIKYVDEVLERRLPEAEQIAAMNEIRGFRLDEN